MTKENNPCPAKQALFAFLHPFFQDRQHAFRPDTRFHPGPPVLRFSGLLSLLALPPVFLPPVCPSRFHLPAPLRSTPITALLRYYGGSDSCLALLSPNRSPCFTCTTFLTIPSPPTPCAPIAAFARYPSARWLSRFRRSRLHHSLAGSPDTHGRFEFVILRTGRSPPVALHPASRRRSYSRLQAGERMPEEDFHLSVHARSQAH